MRIVKQVLVTNSLLASSIAHALENRWVWSVSVIILYCSGRYGLSRESLRNLRRIERLSLYETSLVYSSYIACNWECLIGNYLIAASRHCVAGNGKVSF